MKKCIIILSLFSLLIFPIHADAKRFTVKRIIDGDTIVLGNKTRVRLIGIDAPELSKGECYSKKSKKKLRKLIKGKRVELRYDKDKWDRYKRKLAYVYLKKKFINKTMVVTGNAVTMFISPNYKKRIALRKAEKKAIRLNRGLWGKCVDDKEPSPIYECSYNAYNCSDFNTQIEAQEIYDTIKNKEL